MASKQKRTFNYLGRANIPATAFEIMPSHADGAVGFVIRRLEIEQAGDFGHDESTWRSGEVWIEAWRQASTDWCRELVGTVKDLHRLCASGKRFELQGFPAPDGIVFTIKVVEPKSGRLLACGVSKDERTGGADDLLPVMVEPSLGEVPWRLCWSDDHSEGPVLLVNAALTSPTGIVARDLRAKAATLPQVVREIMHYLAMDAQARESDWGTAWLKFVGREASDIPETGSWADAIMWAEQVVEEFCDRMSWVTRLRKEELGKEEVEELDS
jgi:hypothetical protein